MLEFSGPPPECAGHGLGRSESQATGSGPGLTGLSDSATGVTGQAHINLDSTKRPTPCQIGCARTGRRY